MTVWAVYVEETGELLGAWSDVYQAKHEAQTYEHQYGVACVVKESVLTLTRREP